MPIWPGGSIEDIPEITLVRWRIIEFPNGDMHFNG